MMGSGMEVVKEKDDANNDDQHQNGNKHLDSKSGRNRSSGSGFKHRRTERYERRKASAPEDLPPREAFGDGNEVQMEGNWI
jgi:hypothetical protein